MENAEADSPATLTAFKGSSFLGKPWNPMKSYFWEGLFHGQFISTSYELKDDMGLGKHW